MRIQLHVLQCLIWLSLTFFLYSETAHAIASFSRQAGLACSACHTNSFGPNLTPFGRKFKLGGYTMGDANPGIPPISGQILGSFTHTDQAQPRQATGGPSGPAFNGNDNLTFDAASLYYGGRIYGPVGTFAQITYDGVENRVAIDHIDLRFARDIELWGHGITYGLSFNNNPTVQDLWNTVPAWSFPFASSPIAPTAEPSPLIADALALQVGGGSLNAMIDDFLYVEAGAYGNWSVGTQKAMGVWSRDNPLLDGGAPYWRVAIQHEWAKQYLAIGTFGLRANLLPNRSKAFGADQYTDLGADLTYQYLGSMEHIFEFRGSYIRENQQLHGTQLSGGAAKSSLMLNALNLNASYTYAQTYSANFGFFNVTGTSDPLRYADFAAFSPSSQGFITEVDYVPFGKSNTLGGMWLNLRFAVQYVAYTKFNGTATQAGDNNTLLLNGWLAF
jgi:hypothetical protein